ISPGFIDGHTHIGHYCRPFEYLQAYLPHGTTGLVASCDEQATVFGFRGVKLFLDEVAAHPLRVYTVLSMVAPQDPLLCSTKSLTQAEVAEALEDPRVIGLGEIVSWLRLLQGDDELLERIAMARQRGKIIHGHTAGARDQKLSAIAAAGVSSCHEPINEAEALQRLRSGYWTMLREGSFRRDLEAALAPIVARGLSTQRLILVTDGMSPDDVLTDGHMDFVVRRAIEIGLPPLQAIRAATLNPAVYSGLEQEIGGIAPGRHADFALLEDLRGVRVRATFVDGKVVAQDGASLVDAKPIAWPKDTFHSLHIAPGVKPAAFRVACASARTKARVMQLAGQTITAERIVEFGTRDGALHANPAEDIMKVAVFERHRPQGGVALGFLKGFGARMGAVGMTTNLDENTLMVAGYDDEDMARCANLLIESGGGIAIVDRGEVLARMEFPAGGIFSLEPWEEIGRKLDRAQRSLRERGAPFPKPLYALAFLTFVTLPALRITARGLVSAKERKIVPLLL
ncbi:MAG TPA: adenine deaminase C-terminal domain-containing protein, partial [Candidatus Binatia bacterium]